MQCCGDVLRTSRNPLTFLAVLFRPGVGTQVSVGFSSRCRSAGFVGTSVSFGPGNKAHRHSAKFCSQTESLNDPRRLSRLPVERSIRHSERRKNSNKKEISRELHGPIKANFTVFQDLMPASHNNIIRSFSM